MISNMFGLSLSILYHTHTHTHTLCMKSCYFVWQSLFYLGDICCGPAFQHLPLFYFLTQTLPSLVTYITHLNFNLSPLSCSLESSSVSKSFPLNQTPQIQTMSWGHSMLCDNKAVFDKGCKYSLHGLVVGVHFLHPAMTWFGAVLKTKRKGGGLVHP